MNATLVASITHKTDSSLSLDSNIHKRICKTDIRLISERSSSWLRFSAAFWLLLLDDIIILWLRDLIRSVDFNANHERTSFLSLENFALIWRNVQYSIVSYWLTNERNIDSRWQKFIQFSNMIDQVFLLIRFLWYLNAYVSQILQELWRRQKPINLINLLLRQGSKTCPFRPIHVLWRPSIKVILSSLDLWVPINKHLMEVHHKWVQDDILSLNHDMILIHFQHNLIL